MAPSSNQPFEFATPLGGVIRGARAIFRVNFDKRQCAKAGETVAVDHGDEDMFSAPAIAAD